MPLRLLAISALLCGVLGATLACGPSIEPPARGHPASAETEPAPLPPVGGALTGPDVDPSAPRTPGSDDSALPDGVGVPPSRPTGAEGGHEHP
jgi:hypothetical protein